MYQRQCWYHASRRKQVQSGLCQQASKSAQKSKRRKELSYEKNYEVRHAPNETTQSCLFSVILSHLILTIHIYKIGSELGCDAIINTVLLLCQLMFHIILITLILSFSIIFLSFIHFFVSIDEDQRMETMLLLELITLQKQTTSNKYPIIDHFSYFQQPL